MKYRCSSEGEKGWTEIEASDETAAAAKFKKQTGRVAANVLPVAQGWGWGA